MRVWFSGPRLFGNLVRPGISFGPEDFRRLGIVGYAVLVIIKGVLAIVLAAVAALCFYLIVSMIHDAI
jgi:hypothetical protein